MKFLRAKNMVHTSHTKGDISPDEIRWSAPSISKEALEVVEKSELSCQLELATCVLHTKSIPKACGE